MKTSEDHFKFAKRIELNMNGYSTVQKQKQMVNLMHWHIKEGQRKARLEQLKPKKQQNTTTAVSEE